MKGRWSRRLLLHSCWAGALLSCSDSLSPPALTGPPILRANINGVPWSVDSTDYLVVAEGLDSSLFILVGQLPVSYPRQMIGFFLPKDSVGPYSLADFRTSAGAGFLSIPYSGGPSDEFDTDSTHLGVATVAARDTASRVITGTFSFQASNHRTGAVVAVVGSFRLKYTPATP
jgi:hypothetical protein